MGAESRYHLHGEGERRGVPERPHDHFKAQYMVKSDNDESLADSDPAIELYDQLIGLGRHQEAYELSRERIDDATLYRLGGAHHRLELLRALFPREEQATPRLDAPNESSFVLNSLALSYRGSGQLKTALALLEQGIRLDEQEEDFANLAVGLINHSDTQRLVTLHSPEYSARRSLLLTRDQEDGFGEAASLLVLGNVLTTRGEVRLADAALRWAEQLFQQQGEQQFEGIVSASRAELALHRRRTDEARQLADSAWQLASAQNHERDFIRAARLQGSAALQLNELTVADERLHHALGHARAIDNTEEELPTLIALAELHRRREDPETARELLDQVWLPAERGPYLFHADALNVLAQIERDAGDREAAVDAATDAFELAWCDGPPYAYHWGLEAARAHLRELEAPEPELPPFNPAAHEPMPEVEIDPGE